jgi:hypothetical protein
MALSKIIKEFGARLSLVFDGKDAEKATKAIDKITGGLKGVVLGVSAASASILGMMTIAGDHSRELEDNSKALGINVEQLQKLQYAAKIAANVSGEELNGALQGLSKTLFEARRGNIDAARSLIDLRIPLQMIRDQGTTADQVLFAVSDQLAKMPDGAYKTALANQVLGESLGAKLLPALAEGSKGLKALGDEGQRAGVILSGGMIKESAEFSKQLSKSVYLLKSISFLIGNLLIKHFFGLIEVFNKFLIQNRKFLANGLTNMFKLLGVYITIVTKTVTGLLGPLSHLFTLLGGMERILPLIAVGFAAISSTRLIMSLFNVVKSFKSIGAVIGIVSSPVVLLSAAIAALILIIQDLTSDDSIIKEWLDNFSDDFPNAFKFIKGAIDLAAASLGKMGQFLKDIFGWVSGIADGFAKWAHLSEALNSAKEFVSKLYHAGDNKDGAGFLGRMGESMSGLAQGIQGNATASASGGNKTNNMTANISVTVPAGTNAADATAIVSGGTQKGFEAMLRSTRDQTLGGVAY